MLMSGRRAELSLQTGRDEMRPAGPSRQQTDRSSNQVRFLRETAATDNDCSSAIFVSGIAVQLYRASNSI